MEELEKNETSTQAEENTVSLASAQALADALAKIEVYTPTTWVDNSSPDIDAEHLNKPEQAIKRVTDALNSAVDVIKDLQSQVTKNAGDISTVNNNLSNSRKTVRTPTSITTGTNILKLDPGIYSYEDSNASDEQKLAMGFPKAMWHSEITVTGYWADNNKSTGYINIVVRDCNSDTPRIYENLFSWNEWRGWQSYALKSDLWPQSSGTEITAGTDMQTITTPGHYCCGNNGVAASLKNCPMSDAFTLVVYRAAGGSGDNIYYVAQEYTSYLCNRRVIQTYNKDSKKWTTHEIQFKS